jgi:hypothetical protein
MVVTISLKRKIYLEILLLILFNNHFLFSLLKIDLQTIPNLLIKLILNNLKLIFRFDSLLLKELLNAFRKFSDSFILWYFKDSKSPKTRLQFAIKQFNGFFNLVNFDIAFLVSTFFDNKKTS